MSEPTVGIIVTARVESSRLPRKVLEVIRNRRAIEWLLTFCSRSGLPIVLAIPKSESNDILEHIGKAFHGEKRKGGDGTIEVYRGEDGSPLHRLAAAAARYKFDHIVRITADDCWIEPTLLRRQVQWHLDKDADYTYCRKAPEGTCGEVIRTTVLQAAAEKMAGRDVEFVSYYVRGDTVKVEEFRPPQDLCLPMTTRQGQDLGPVRLCLDHPADLTVARIIVNALQEPFTLWDMVQYLKADHNAYVAKINRLPLVTVYTCNFNQSRFLFDCLHSVSGQMPRNWEYLVMDDCSTDDSMNRIMEWYTALPADLQSAVHVRRNERNLGLPATCNRAIAMARGKYIVRLDADDQFIPDAVARMVDTLHQVPEAAALFSGYAEMDEMGTLGNAYPENVNEHPGCAMFLTRAAHDVRFRDGLEHYEGAEFMKRFKEHYQVAHNPEVLWLYRRHSAGKSIVPSAEREAVRAELGLPPSVTAS